MGTALKLLPVLTLLMTGVSIAQTTATKPPAQQTKPKTSAKQMGMDPKMHDQMMADAKKMDAELQALKKSLADERAKGMDPAQHAEMMKASDQQIEALQNTAKNLRQQLEATPKYLEQTNASSP
jgi:hypothetical protein